MSRCLLLFLIVAIISVKAQYVTVDVRQLGMLYGNDRGAHYEFLNIPYVEPPIGKLRWKNPVPKLAWGGLLDATRFGPGCPQDCKLPEAACPTVTSEDCIQLNIFTPRDINGTSYPVMVFFPGGAFTQGTAGFDLYNGRFFVERGDVVVVTVNYRLGALGYLSTTSTLGGNFGLLDQIEALKFVKKNIRYFGGNSEDVTVFGQSAGAISVGALLVSPKGAGLFHKAIMQSNPFALPLKTTRSALEQGDKFLQYSRCSDNINCLQSLPIDTIIAAQTKLDGGINIPYLFDSFLSWAPRAETSLIPDHPFYLFLKGEYHKMPILTGAVTNEGIPFISLAFKKKIGGFVYKTAITVTFGISTGSTMLSHYYPSSSSGDNRMVLADLITDYMFICPTRNLTMSLSKETTDVYLYQYSHVESFDVWGDKYPECVGKVCHSADLFLSWGTPPLFGYNFTKQEKELSTLMLDYWTNFARTGNPNTGNRVVQPQWPSFSSNNLLNVNLEGTTTRSASIQTKWKQSNCDFFDSKGYQFGWNIFGESIDEN